MLLIYLITIAEPIKKLSRLEGGEKKVMMGLRGGYVSSLGYESGLYSLSLIKLYIGPTHTHTHTHTPTLAATPVSWRRVAAVTLAAKKWSSAVDKLSINIITWSISVSVYASLSRLWPDGQKCRSKWAQIPFVEG